MVPSVRRPWAKLLTRCSTTWSTTVSALPLSSSLSLTRFLVTHNEAVWKGACGISPLNPKLASR